MSLPMNKGPVTLLLAMLWSQIVSAQPDAESAYFSCRSCHGDNGEGSAAIHAPAINCAIIVTVFAVCTRMIATVARWR
jgi:cytochrome c553